MCAFDKSGAQRNTSERSGHASRNARAKRREGSEMALATKTMMCVSCACLCFVCCGLVVRVFVVALCRAEMVGGVSVGVVSFLCFS